MKRGGVNVRKGMKVLKRVAVVGLALVLIGCGVSGMSSQSTAGQRQSVKTGAAGRDASTADLPTLRVVMTSFTISLPTEYIGRNKLDEEADFKVDTIILATGAPMNEALATDLWDVGAMGAAAVTGVANHDMMIIGEVLESTGGLGAFVKPDSPIAQVKGHNPSYPNVLGDPGTVKGVTTLPSIGTAQHSTILKRLKKLGLGITDVNVVNMDTAQAYQVLQTNQYDVVVLSVPTLFEAVDDGMVQVGNLVDLGTGYVGMVVANRKTVGGKQELVQKYVDYVEEVCKALSDDSDMAANLMVDPLKGAGAEANGGSCISDLGRVRFITVEDWKDREVGNFARELGEFYISLGQPEPELVDKSDSNTVSDFVKSGD